MSRELCPGLYVVDFGQESTQVVIDFCEFFASVGIPLTRKNLALALSAIQTALDQLGGAVQIELVAPTPAWKVVGA